MNRLATVAAYATYSAERTALHALGTRGTGAQVLSMPQGGV